MKRGFLYFPPIAKAVGSTFLGRRVAELQPDPGGGGAGWRRGGGGGGGGGVGAFSGALARP